MSDRNPAAACCGALTETLRTGLFKALSSPTRLDLLLRLVGCGCSTTVSELSAGGGVDLSVTSRHLAQLKRAGVVSSERTGREVRYRPKLKALAATLRELADHLDACSVSCDG